MNTRMRFIIYGFKITQYLLAVILLAGCGQSGNLFLSEPAEVINPASSTPTEDALSKSEVEPSEKN